MNPKPAIPVLLLLLASLGCLSAAPAPPPVAVEEPVPEELRIYAVADILGHLGRVPLRGCCVLPLPAVQAVSYSPGWIRAEAEGSAALPAEDERQRYEREAERMLTEARLRQVAIERWEPRYPRRFGGSENALLEHIESRLAVASGGPIPCHLAVKQGFALVAQGSPGALAVVERALEELR